MRNFLWLLLITLAACNPTNENANIKVMAYVPVYASPQTSKLISSEPVRTTTNAGKIYAYGNYLFQVEQNEGIHVIDNSNPQQAKKIGFIKIPGASELAIKANYLYTNNINDLVVLDISNIASPQVVNRVADAFPPVDQSYPPASRGYFECPDASKGTVIGWEEKLIDNPKCRR